MLLAAKLVQITLYTKNKSDKTLPILDKLIIYSIFAIQKRCMTNARWTKFLMNREFTTFDQGYFDLKRLYQMHTAQGCRGVCFSYL